MADVDPEQSFRSEWQRRMRAECLHFTERAKKQRKPTSYVQALGDVFTVGLWLSTYANATDGKDAFPAEKTLALLAGMSAERVRNCLKVLRLAGAIERKRRPNTSSMHQLNALLGPLGVVPIERHMHVVTETRSKKRHQDEKAQRIADTVRAQRPDGVQARGPETGEADTESSDSVRARVPDRVRAGGSETPGPRARTPSDSVQARVPDRVRAGGVQKPLTDAHLQEGAQVVFEPQVDGGAWEVADEIPEDPDEIRKAITEIDVWMAEHQCSEDCTDDGPMQRRRIRLERALRSTRPPRRFPPKAFSERRAS